MSRICAVVLFSVSSLVGFDPISRSNASLNECYTVSTWNLEYYGFTKKRGFPEYTKGGPLYAPRTEEQRAAVAAAIRDKIGARIVVLNEIDSQNRQSGLSPLEDLVERLGSSWKSRTGLEGGNQRIALVWDSRYVALNGYKEIQIEEVEVEGKDIFDRDPLLAHFTLLKDGKSMNDLLVVGLHLASGQRRYRNHDTAMARLRKELTALRGNDCVLPRSEADILIAGDLNANAFDNYTEQFFRDFNHGEWRVLAKDGNYPATRLSGVPLKYGAPIDYILATVKSDEFGGLAGEEILESEAKVWTDLIENDDLGAFREVYSDHLPVSVCVRAVVDTD